VYIHVKLANAIFAQFIKIAKKVNQPQGQGRLDSPNLFQPQGHGRLDSPFFFGYVWLLLLCFLVFRLCGGFSVSVVGPSTSAGVSVASPPLPHTVSVNVTSLLCPLSVLEHLNGRAIIACETLAVSLCPMTKESNKVSQLTRGGKAGWICKQMPCFKNSSLVGVSVTSLLCRLSVLEHLIGRSIISCETLAGSLFPMTKESIKVTQAHLTLLTKPDVENTHLSL
jgi:hypothetical protein